MDESSPLVFSGSWALDAANRDLLWRRLGEAASWISARSYGDDPAKILRSRELAPPLMEAVAPFAWELSEFKRCLEYVVETRARLLRESRVRLVSKKFVRTAGRLLGHHFDNCTADGLSNAVSPIFDANDHIGWDAWLCCLLPHCADRSREDHRTFLAWIPERYVLAVERAMNSTTDCLQWVPWENLKYENPDP